jgi:predicted nuclease of predicted toxin-antitoxin system
LSHRFYLDENVDVAIREGLRRRGIDVLSVQEDGRTGDPDHLVLDRADELGRVLFTRDADFLAEASARLSVGETFPTVIYAKQIVVSLRQCIEDLELFAQAATNDEGRDRVIYLPLR